MKIPRRIGHLPNFERGQEPNSPRCFKKIASDRCLFDSARIETSIDVMYTFPIRVWPHPRERNIESRPGNGRAWEKISPIKYASGEKYRRHRNPPYVVHQEIISISVTAISIHLRMPGNNSSICVYAADKSFGVIRLL